MDDPNLRVLSIPYYTANTQHQQQQISEEQGEEAVGTHVSKGGGGEEQHRAMGSISETAVTSHWVSRMIPPNSLLYSRHVLTAASWSICDAFPAQLLYCVYAFPFGHFRPHTAPTCSTFSFAGS